MPRPAWGTRSSITLGFKRSRRRIHSYSASGPFLVSETENEKKGAVKGSTREKLNRMSLAALNSVQGAEGGIASSNLTVSLRKTTHERNVDWPNWKALKAGY
eukprot:gb/GECG01008932.1/.p1 GENE.gb/GECG01008932.1/~~gb/GECG01008932.1/.p1  ORF type:complete len:102 (+),score=7.10 gb/GECG01008932.1/:1-306(+)